MRIRVSFVLFAATTLLILIGARHTWSSKGAASTGQSATKRQPVIVELFTSEGCSSCPPADALVKELSERQSVPGAEIIAFEEHVDYWDHLGWKDPYSSFAFTERQADYAKVFGGDGVYTPQMIVDGQSELVGSRSYAARSAIEKAASQPKMTLQFGKAIWEADDSVAIEIQVSNLAGLGSAQGAELWIAITEQGLHTEVKAGENSGENLQHAPVVRSIIKADSFRPVDVYKTQTSLKLNPGWQRNNLSFVAFVVEQKSRKIIGATSTKLPGRS